MTLKRSVLGWASRRLYDEADSMAGSKMKRFVIRFLVAIALLCAVFGAVLTVYAAVITGDASAIVGGLYGLKVGASSIADVERMASQLRSGVWKKKECDGNKCLFSFSVDNSLLRKTRLEPAAEFYAEVAVANGIVRRIFASLRRDTGVFPSFPSAGMVTEYEVYPSRHEALRPYDFPQPIGKPYLDVKLNRYATPEQRRHAYAFSITCLTKPGRGCDLPCDYLPLAWHDWTPQWETIPGYQIFYPERARCQ